MDICGTPRRYFFEMLQLFTTAEHERERLEYFASIEGQVLISRSMFYILYIYLGLCFWVELVKEDLRNYCHRERRSFVEVFEDFPHARPPLQYLLEMIYPLQARQFSISSALEVFPRQCHITVAVVSYLSPMKRPRHGLCSTWLSSLPEGIPSCVTTITNNKQHKQI